ncbi:hypothetical protein Poli38472_003635 [Pythium oligandrum]|uniref:Uncharacterized protein n=1 Tax=Pythium oligandrum TaxID=41045 RepID=A0A8K1CNJ4_PYTOL|nr:hypothetical protein Poli38472_003635 [Pythium oligandrum]|eukprot:TMW65870.1 hypothetical protein Poli38472_003635 [Pythium oligandrum]
MTTSFEFDHAYLRETVGVPLTEAMAQLAIVQPEDPVEFLGQFLLKYVDNELHKQELERFKQQQMTTPPPTTAMHLYGLDTGNQSNAEMEQLLKLERDLPALLDQATTIPDLFRVYLTWLASVLNAEEAYIGRKTADPNGTSLVHWIASSRGVSPTIDKFVTEEVGMTFDVFKPIEEDPDAPPSLDADGNPLPPAEPKYLHVENVLREPRMKFFHVPKLGAYLTRGLKYKRFLHAQVFNEASPEEPNILDDWAVLSVDTIGQARAFTQHEIDAFVHSSSLFSHALETLERTLYMKDVERKTTGGEDEKLKEFSVAFGAEVSVQEENLALQVQSLADEDKTLKESELRVSYMTYLLVSHVPTLSLASSRVVPFKLPVLMAFATALELLGHAKAAVYNPVTKVPAWERIAPLLEEASLKPDLEAFSIEVMPNTASVKQDLNELTKSNIDATSPIAGCFLAWAQAVAAHADHVEAAAERARALQEQAAAEDE